VDRLAAGDVGAEDIERGYLRQQAAFHHLQIDISDLDQMAADNPTTKGLTIVTPQGLIANPLVGVVRQAAADMRKYGAEFGLSPASRTRIHVGVAKAVNKFEDLIAA